jgi:hypothetical protein
MPQDATADESKGSPALSDVLLTIAGDRSKDRIFVSDILHAMEDRAVVALILLFALPNVLPVPPGTSAILGAPLLFVTAQLALGKKPWLPRAIARRSVATADFAALMNRATPWLARAERLLRPRLQVLTRPASEQLIGALCVVLALILFLPIPLGNMLPALAISVLALGILQRDGVWVLAGVATAFVSIAVVWGVMLAVAKAGVDLLLQLFS